VDCCTVIGPTKTKLSIDKAPDFGGLVFFVEVGATRAGRELNMENGKWKMENYSLNSPHSLNSLNSQNSRVTKKIPKGKKGQKGQKGKIFTNYSLLITN
jgi:hypothetical protein